MTRDFCFTGANCETEVFFIDSFELKKRLLMAIRGI